MTSPGCDMVFIDLETTGATATRDRITEIGLIQVTEQGVSRYSQLVNPQARIPEFIQGLTGITNEMVQDQPTFAQLAPDLFDRLHGRLFVAHNARFDYGFIKNEFKRLGIDFRARVLCTVKLSRELYPEESRHNLDALIARHGLSASGRHRALADADLIYQFWNRLIEKFSPDQITQAVAKLSARPTLPSHLDADLPEQLPESHGVYIFYGENDFVLYVGKSNNLRKRVMSHFASDHSRGKELSLSMQVRRVQWIQADGEISALLKESELIKTMLPSHNMRLRRNKELCSWQIDNAAPSLVWARDLNLGAQPNLFGIFKSERDAIQMLSELAQKEKLCKALLGLEKIKPGAPCFGYQLKNCKGGCMGKEKPALHHARLLMAIARHRIPEWPHPGPVGLREGQTVHVVDHWCYLGAAQSDEELCDLLESGEPTFDADVFKILRKAMKILPVSPLHFRKATELHAEDCP